MESLNNMLRNLTSTFGWSPELEGMISSTRSLLGIGPLAGRTSSNTGVGLKTTPLQAPALDPTAHSQPSRSYRLQE